MTEEKKMTNHNRDKLSELKIKRFIDGILQCNCNTNPEWKETPRRLADLYHDMTEGMKIDIKQFFKPLPSHHDQMIVVAGIEFVSMCEHHWWPFFGKVHIAYVPNGNIVGLSKFHSAVRALSRRPQLQERMTTDLTDAIEETLKPKGTMVVIEARHTCMMVGGRYDYGMPAHTDSVTKTSDVKGVFLLFEAPRMEALSLIYGGHPHE